ncbi:MAG: phage terminase large subunit [Desulfuromonadaceae bacterium]
MNILCLDRFKPLVERPKRIKILVGGRGSTKSTFVSDYVIACISKGQLWCCAREFQNSIDESVHRLLEDEIDRLGFQGFSSDKSHIYHSSGGRNFYRGLSRNIRSIKSMLSGVDGLWIEEGESLSDATLHVLTASVRVSAKKAGQVLAGGKAKMPEIWISMNRDSSADAIAQKWLKRADQDLERCGFYEDDVVMAVEANWDDVPRDWFLASGLEDERLDDLENLPRAVYDNKWGGKYLDTIDRAIILPEWFDACVDAHVKLGFKPVGKIVAAYDPADSGDPKGYILRHGSVILEAEERTEGDVDDGMLWALGKAVDDGADLFVWDCDGLGLGQKGTVSRFLAGKKIDWAMFKGSEGVDRPDEPYDGDRSTTGEQKTRTNKQTCKNKRAQYYRELRDRIRNTYKAVVKGEYVDPDKLLSISSECKSLKKFRTEVCRIPEKPNANSLFQIMSKVDMKNMLKIPSPNVADPAMMSLFIGEQVFQYSGRMPGSSSKTRLI